MAVLTADIAMKNDVLRGFGETADYAVFGSDAADEEYRRDVREIYEDSIAMLSKKTITKTEFDNIMNKCRDREYARKTAERQRDFERMFAEGHAIALKYGITEDDINEAIMEVREEMSAKKELAKNK